MLNSMVKIFINSVVSITILLVILCACKSNDKHINTFDSIQLHVPIDTIEEIVPISTVNESEIHENEVTVVDPHINSDLSTISNADFSLINDSSASSSIQNDETVWVSANGKKYHSKPDCSNMKSPLEKDITSAINDGYEPCKRCYK